MAISLLGLSELQKAALSWGVTCCPQTFLQKALYRYPANWVFLNQRKLHQTTIAYKNKLQQAVQAELSQNIPTEEGFNYQTAKYSEFAVLKACTQLDNLVTTHTTTPEHVLYLTPNATASQNYREGTAKLFK